MTLALSLTWTPTSKLSGLSTTKPVGKINLQRNVQCQKQNQVKLVIISHPKNGNPLSIPGKQVTTITFYWWVGGGHPARSTTTPPDGPNFLKFIQFLGGNLTKPYVGAPYPLEDCPPPPPNTLGILSFMRKNTPLAKHKRAALLREKSGKWHYKRKIVLTCLPRRSRTSCPCTCHECVYGLWADHWRTRHGTPPGDPRFLPRASPHPVPGDLPSAPRCALGTRAGSDGCSSHVPVVWLSGCAGWSCGLFQCNKDVLKKTQNLSCYFQ